MSIEVGCNRPRPIPPTPIPPIGCICRQVLKIDQIQKEAILEESVFSCGNPNLGGNVRNRRFFNTRPFSLYLPNGERLSIVVDQFDTPFNIDNVTQPELNIENLGIEIDNLEDTNPNQANLSNTNPNIRGKSSNRVNNATPVTTIRPNRVSASSHIPTRANVFRVESIDGCCAVLRALLPRRGIESLDGGRSRGRFIATCTFCTVDLNDFVCIQCFDDTYVNLGVCFE